MNKCRVKYSGVDELEQTSTARTEFTMGTANTGYPTEVHLGSKNIVDFENGFENGSSMMEITVLPDRIRAWN